MIGQSRSAYFLVRAGVLFFRAITPLSILYCSLRLLRWPVASRALLPLDIIASAETAFYTFVFLPRKYLLQRPAVHPPVLSRDNRRVFFHKCLSTVPDLRQFLLLWSNDKPSEVKRENVKEWLCWALLNKDYFGEDEDEELEEYVSEVERVMGRKLSPGYGRATSLRLTLDGFTTLHRPLLYYVFGVGGMDTIAHAYLLSHSYQFYRLALRNFFTSFPFRPLTLFTKHQSPAEHLSYYYHPHSSPSRLPVVFIHGIGVGIHTYIQLMKEFNETSDAESKDGSVGFMALEIMPISFRVTHAFQERQEMCDEILQILEYHSWTRFVLMSQSYGTIISTHMLHDPRIAPRIGPMIHLDPVTWLLHLPEVAYNFTRRIPREANEHQLYYFACTDIGVAHTLARHFFWAENILWKEEIGNRKMTVFLGAKDIVVNTEAVGNYLTREDGIQAIDDHRDSQTWKTRKWSGEGIDVVWLPECDHGEVVDHMEYRKQVLDVTMQYCSARG